MWLLVLVVLECYVTLHFIRTLNYGFLTLAFFYAMYRALDDSEYTGDARFNGLRRLRVWRLLSPVEHLHSDTDNNARKKSRIYVVMPSAGDVYASLVWGVGLHGGALSAGMADSLVYVVPPIFLWVPLLREVLLWSGAITFSARRSLTTVLQDVLASGRSVALYSCMTSEVPPPPPPAAGARTLYVTQLSTAMFDFVRQKKFLLAHVYVSGATERYWVHHVLPYGNLLTRFIWTHTRYPFPVLWCYRFFARTRPPPMKLAFGNLLKCDPKVYETADALRHAFEASAMRAPCAELGGPIIQFSQ